MAPLSIIPAGWKVRRSGRGFVVLGGPHLDCGWPSAIVRNGRVEVGYPDGRHADGATLVEAIAAVEAMTPSRPPAPPPEEGGGNPFEDDTPTMGRRTYWRYGRSR